MIHRLYPIINIQAVVCTNTPSNHGGSPGRRITFKLGSMVASVPPPSHRSLPLLPRPPRDGDGPQSTPPGAQGPPPGKGLVASSSRASPSKAKAQPRPRRFPPGRGFVWLPFPFAPRALHAALPPSPTAAPRWDGGRRAERQPRLRYFYSSPDLCGARPLPCRALPSGCISALGSGRGRSPFTSARPAGPTAGSARPLRPEQRPQRPEGTGRGRGTRTRARRKQTKWPWYASGRGGGGSSQPACPPLAAGLPPPFPKPGPGRASKPGGLRAASSELCPGPARASPGRGAAGRAPRLGAGR